MPRLNDAYLPILSVVAHLGFHIPQVVALPSGKRPLDILPLICESLSKYSQYAHHFRTIPGSIHNLWPDWSLTPHLNDAYPPILSVVGAFRVPYTPHSASSGPAFEQETTWFPPPHLWVLIILIDSAISLCTSLIKQQCTRLRLNTAFWYSSELSPSPSASSKVKAPLALRGLSEPSASADMSEDISFSIDFSLPFHCGSSPQDIIGMSGASLVKLGV